MADESGDVKKEQADVAKAQDAARAGAPAGTHAESPRSKDSRARDGRPRPPRANSEFIRAENEDDDGYDPYSDRRPEPEPLFERDPWD